MFFGFGFPTGFSAYEGVKMAYLAVMAVALAILFRKETAREWPSVWKSPAFKAGAFLFVASVLANGTDPVADAVAGRTYSAVGVLEIGALFLLFRAFPAELRAEALRAAVSGFVCVNLPYALVQWAGFDPVSPYLTLPEWGPGRAF